MLSREEIEKLAEKKLTGTITPEEQAVLEEWLNQPPSERMWWVSGDADEEAFRQRLLARIKDDAGIGQTLAPVRKMRAGRWWWAAAAIILVAISAYFFLQPVPAEKQTVAATPVPAQDIKAPATNRAMITLAGGQTVFLDSAANGSVATQDGVHIIKLADGQISYEGSKAAASGGNQEVVFNTLSNPRGSKVIDIRLADGSHVWLNAGSTITYPIAFTSNERKVTVTGEAYFDVVHDDRQPFRVLANGMLIEDFGTQFNVNAYSDEPAVKTTLIEGIVEVSVPSAPSPAERKAVRLKPGQQAVVAAGMKVINNVDMDEVTAWRYDKFQFGEKADIETIMRQIARWYDVDVEYRGTVSVHFGGRISRRADVSQVLEKLALTGSVKFKTEGRKIIVMP